MPRYDQFIGGEFEWFTAEVEDINDPEKLNRVKVRCHGWHTDDTGVLKTSDLPWATVIMPATSASYKGIGSNHELMVGSWVVGFFRDGPSAQDPIIMGSIATKSNGIIDIPTEAQLNPPTNKVHKTEGGHLIEYDNTDGSKRINIQHASGTTININNDGTVEINAINDIVNIDGNTTITGTLHVTGAQTNDSTIVAQDEITGKGIPLSTHKHDGSPTAGSGPKSDTGLPKP